MILRARFVQPETNIGVGTTVMRLMIERTSLASPSAPLLMPRGALDYVYDLAVWRSPGPCPIFRESA